jgi:hypothetical protein
MLYNVSVGRKPQGLGKGGEPKKIRDYPKLLVTIRPSIRNKLKRMAAREQRPMWKIVESALLLYGKNVVKRSDGKR